MNSSSSKLAKIEYIRNNFEEIFNYNSNELIIFLKEIKQIDSELKFFNDWPEEVLQLIIEKHKSKQIK
tara:strand:- start:443 stop:646 length:204 start_codon:yes stop_codon:yes gene_type:complete